MVLEIGQRRRLIRLAVTEEPVGDLFQCLQRVRAQHLVNEDHIAPLTALRPRVRLLDVSLMEAAPVIDEFPHRAPWRCGQIPFRDRRGIGINFRHSL